VTSTNPLDTPARQARHAETRLGQATPAAPVFQYHALADEIVPLQQAADLRRTWCDDGADVTWSVLPLAEHALGLLQGHAPALSWLSARFSGQPTSNNCAQP
jgi:predicted esterase